LTERHFSVSEKIHTIIGIYLLIWNYEAIFFWSKALVLELYGISTMLENRIQNRQLAKLASLADAGKLATELLAADTLRQEFESGVIRRKEFCEALDVGESTLSTWLQTGRIPRLAAVAYVLWLVVKKLRNEIARRDEAAAEPYVVRCGSGYAVVQPADTPDAFGQVIASGIETAALAQQLAVVRSNRFDKVLGRALDALQAYEEQYDDGGNWVSDIITDLERARDFKVGPVTLDELP
jgi:hypothetical protein